MQNQALNVNIYLLIRILPLLECLMVFRIYHPLVTFTTSSKPISRAGLSRALFYLLQSNGFMYTRGVVIILNANTIVGHSWPGLGLLCG